MLPYPVEKRAGSPMPQAAQGYMGHTRSGASSAPSSASRWRSVPVIVGAVLTSSDPAAVRMPVLVLCAAAYGLALAWIGVRIAARAAEGKLPELCQVAIRTKL